jgi:hypothetical protein
LRVGGFELKQRMSKERRREATSEWGRVRASGVPHGGCRPGIAQRANMSRPPGATGWLRIRRARNLSQVADVALFCPLTPGRHDRTCRHAGPRLKIRYSNPPDAIISSYRVRRTQRCTSSEICYKLMLDLDMLKKVQ